jgi:hypothetical protein
MLLKTNRTAGPGQTSRLQPGDAVNAALAVLAEDVTPA